MYCVSLAGDWKGKTDSRLPTGFGARLYAKEKKRVYSEKRPPPLHGVRQVISLLNSVLQRHRPWISIRGMCRQLQKPTGYLSRTNGADIYQLSGLKRDTLRYWLRQLESIKLIAVQPGRRGQAAAIAFDHPDGLLTAKTSLDLL